MDGYIKNKKEAIAAVRKKIVCKYAVTSFLILLIAVVWLFALLVDQPPKKWKQKDIVYSHISQERIGLRRFDDNVLNARDGSKYVIVASSTEVEAWQAALVSGQTCRVVYSETAAGGNNLEALSDQNTVFQALDRSVAAWEQEHRENIRGLLITLCVEVVALLLIDRIWCRNEHSNIKKLKEDIAHRKERRANKNPLIT